jgi:hypothetical protein
METTAWRKSSRSTGDQNSNCVEARWAEQVFQVRDSKMKAASPVFELSPKEFESLLGAARR